MFKIWMVPLIGIFIAGWIFLGGYMFQKSLLKHSDQRRVKYGAGVLTSLLCGLVGGLPMMAAVYAGMKLGADTPNRLLFFIIGSIAGLISFIAVGYLVVFTMFKKLSAKTALSASLIPLVVIIALGGAVGLACGIPAFYQNRKDNTTARLAVETILKLSRIHDVLLRKFATDPPKTLDVLVEQQLLSKNDITSPAKPDGKGFFYYPPDRILSRNNDHVDELLACDYSENFDGEDYVVVYTYGMATRLGEHAFKAVLNKPINEKFAKAFRKADRK